MGHIQAIGLGAGDLDQLPLGVYRLLKESSGQLYLRTKEHPAVAELEKEGIRFRAFDEIYEKHDRFEAVYEEISDTLLNAAGQNDIVYAVPGHPLVAEKTVQLLIERGPALGIKVEIKGGQSFIDALFTAVKADPVEGFQLLDGTDLGRDDIHMNQHVIIAQVYDAFVASDVKLTLMEKYPDEYEVVIVKAAGSSEESVRRVPLYKLDHGAELDNLTSVYVPPLRHGELAYKEFSALRQIIAKLRSPEGCPWDRKQTHETLKKYLIEEAYELLDAIDREDIDNMVEELGDVLLQVLLHAQIGEDEGMFQIEDVIESISAKMVRRHPHVFGSVTVEDAEEVMANWEQIKIQEKGEASGQELRLDTVDKGRPALLLAYEYQKQAAKAGFDWDEPVEAWEKVKEEMQEFEEEMAKGNSKEALHEFGDLLFAFINTGRLMKIHPEEALQTANEKFYRRFSYIEKKAREEGRMLENESLEYMDRYWDEAKRKGL